MGFHITFKTEGAIGIPRTEDDAEFIFKVLNSAQWQENIGNGKFKSVAYAETYLGNSISPRFARLEYGNYPMVRNSDKAKN